ncbi:hypothetical protein DFP72DRAFT_848186 [Ephemerocybe angulata]|uniref:Uncharacterized protein n=1 Tax=Ephemerocybe angulata TaxID=980116 RepID=A0A8H6HYT5_9AGAR|nr:hypothetical protein DFP72DRAFT_848186 [Tulosesus angulatus]
MERKAPGGWMHGSALARHMTRHMTGHAAPEHDIRLPAVTIRGTKKDNLATTIITKGRKGGRKGEPLPLENENDPPPRREGGYVPFEVYRDDSHEEQADDGRGRRGDRGLACSGLGGVTEALRVLDSEAVEGPDMARVVKRAMMMDKMPNMKADEYKEGIGVSWLKSYLDASNDPASESGDDDGATPVGGRGVSTVHQVDEEAIQSAYHEGSRQLSTRNPTPSPEPQAGSTSHAEPNPLKRRRSDVEDDMDSDDEEHISMLLRVTAGIQQDVDSSEEEEERRASKKMRMTTEIEEATSASAARAVQRATAEEKRVSGAVVSSVSVDGSHRSGSENPENVRENEDEEPSGKYEYEYEKKTENENETNTTSEAPVASSTHVEPQCNNERERLQWSQRHQLSQLSRGSAPQPRPLLFANQHPRHTFRSRKGFKFMPYHLSLRLAQAELAHKTMVTMLSPSVASTGRYRILATLESYPGVVGVRRYLEPENQASTSNCGLALPEGASPGERERRAGKRVEATLERESATLGAAQSAVFGSVVVRREVAASSRRPLRPLNSRRSGAMVEPEEAVPQAHLGSQLQRQATMAIPDSDLRGPRALVRSFEHVYEVKKPVSKHRAREAKFADLETPEMRRERIRRDVGGVVGWEDLNGRVWFRGLLKEGDDERKRGIDVMEMLAYGLKRKSSFELPIGSLRRAGALLAGRNTRQRHQPGAGLAGHARALAERWVWWAEARPVTGRAAAAKYLPYGAGYKSHVRTYPGPL